MVQQLERCLEEELGEIVAAVKMPSTRTKTKRPQNLYCILVLDLVIDCVG